MSFMGFSLPGGRLGVVSPWAAFRLHQQAQAHPSSPPGACYPESPCHRGLRLTK
jgi:hypothetical protein